MPDRKAIWKSDTHFNYRDSGADVPVFDNIEVVGSGDPAYLALASQGRPTENIDFNTPADYTYDDVKAEIGGKARLKAFVAGETNWPFTTPANYTYDPAKIEVVGGVAKLSGVPEMPYAWWHLNESSGVKAADSSGNGRDGTLVNMEDSDWQAGKLNNCLTFDGIDEYVNCGNVAGFERTDPFSTECWIKTTKIGTQSIISKMMASSPYTGWWLIAASTSLQVNFYGVSGGGSIRVSAATTIEDGIWHHIVFTYSGSSLASGIKLYVDGVSLTFAVAIDTLTGSILNGETCKIGLLGGFKFNGQIDEVAIYSRVLTPNEVLERYNGGVGTESPLGSFSKDNPSIVSNAGFAFGNPLGALTETSAKPGSEIKYHVSADDGVTWKYWNGSVWVVTDDTYTQANMAIEVNGNINTLAGSGTFKFRALLHSDTGAQTPELDNLYIAEGVSYTTIPQEIIKNTDIQPAHVYQWLFTEETVTKPVGTDIKYQYSIDSGSTWNGSWLTELEIEAALFALVLTGDGTDKLKLKFQLSTTDPLLTSEIDNFAITYEVGYESSGSYTCGQYFPANSWMGLFMDDIIYNIDTPTGTTLTVHSRVVKELLEANFDKPWTQYNSGDSIAICGDFMQWYVEMTTSNPAVTPKLNWVEIVFHILIGTLRAMDEKVSDMDTKVSKVLGLSHSNIKIYSQQYNDVGNLLSCNVKTFANANDCNNEVNPLATYLMTSGYHSTTGRLESFKMVEIT